MNVLLLPWDTKPNNRIRRTFLRPAPTRRTSLHAAIRAHDDERLLHTLTGCESSAGLASTVTHIGRIGVRAERDAARLAKDHMAGVNT